MREKCRFGFADFKKHLEGGVVFKTKCSRALQSVHRDYQRAFNFGFALQNILHFGRQKKVVAKSLWKHPENFSQFADCRKVRWLLSKKSRRQHHPSNLQGFPLPRAFERRRKRARHLGLQQAEQILVEHIHLLP